MVTHPEQEDEVGLSGRSMNHTAAKQGGPGRLRSANRKGDPVPLGDGDRSAGLN